RWAGVEKEFHRTEHGEINIVHEAVDRWAECPEKKDQTALVYEKAGAISAFTYQDLKEISCKWAHLLSRHGFNAGDRLFIFLPTCPEAYFAMLGCARIGVIFCNVYPTLGIHEMEWRLENGEPRGVLTNPDLVEVLPRKAMRGSKAVLLTGGEAPGLFAWETVVPDMLERMPDEAEIRWLPPEAPLYMLYTSGSTGPSKAAVHAHQDMAGYLMTGRYVLDLGEDSILWTDASPAWVTGSVYGAFAPWLCGATSVVQGDPFSASTWYRTLERHRISVWYTTPRTIKGLMHSGEDLPTRYDLSSLRHIASVGEKLPAELLYWARRNLGHSAHDTWWMTETGMICIANYPCDQIKPDSMGKPVPGVEAAVLDPNGHQLPAFTLGELGLKAGWPSMMKAIWRDRERYSNYFRGHWFMTGDMVIKDEDGYYYHHGRNDDLIKAGQGFVGPYEIEELLRLHMDVADAAVVSKCSESGSPTMKAFVTVRGGVTPSDRLSREIKAFVQPKLPAELTLTEIRFLDELPKTSSGKIVRRALRAIDLGLPSGNVSRLQE
ncbi:MAG: AMP-binding protein, partial [Deltaproteobacteria bacterium]|nr:AMP-binding protein [Deltaproteobacteria bacterium]